MLQRFSLSYFVVAITELFCSIFYRHCIKVSSYMVNVHGGPIERVKMILHTYLLWYFENRIILFWGGVNMCIVTKVVQ